MLLNSFIHIKMQENSGGDSNMVFSRFFKFMPILAVIFCNGRAPCPLKYSQNISLTSIPCECLPTLADSCTPCNSHGRLSSKSNQFLFPTKLYKTQQHCAMMDTNFGHTRMNECTTCHLLLTITKLHSTTRLVLACL